VTARELSGRQLATDLRSTAAEHAAGLAADGVAARLEVVTATRDESAAWYVRSLVVAAGKVGIACRVSDLGADAEPGRIADALAALSADAAVHGIIVQTPLPKQAKLAELAGAIDPAKDVDGASPLSLGRLAAGEPAFAPATAEAVLRLLDYHGVELAGRRAVVVGRSVVVGKPLALLLLARDATVTICHSRTRDLADVTSQAEVLVAAAGRPGLITAANVGPGATVIDVGTNATGDGGLVGDVQASSVSEVAGALSPVPGGVGPVTTAQLLVNTVSAAATLAGNANPASPGRGNAQVPGD
jgi:methylenetetrahydrofolate dehydrogenase (NADP+) / methenyltetrahydrofolate cyclohydrolase